MSAKKLRKTGKQRIHVRLYSRLMICNTLIFLSITYVFAFFATKYYLEFETLKKLQQSKNALSAISDYYELKQSNFPNIILPFYQVSDNHFNLDSLLRAPTDEILNDPTSKMEIISILQKITDQDGDIKEILLYKELSGSKYVYQRKNKTMEIASEGYPFFEEMSLIEFGRINIGSRKTGIGTAADSNIAYGIGGIIGLDKDAGAAGKFLVTFNIEALERIYQEYSGTYGRFLLFSANGDIIFDTDRDYTGDKFLYAEVFYSGKENITIDGQDYYVQTIADRKSGVIGANIVPKNIFDYKNTVFLVYGILTSISMICVALYMVSGHFISRRINKLVNAMQLVGANNLSYRIPVQKPSDEFEEIAVKFNEMCDELQKIIECEYVNEIKKKNAVLSSLQAGINPHFLYNTLEVIRVTAVDAGSNDVSKMIVNLANLYRAIVHNHTFIPIINEVNICDMYMDIFQFRYGNCLEYEVNVNPQLMGYGIPKNLLQPIIENYFVHGIRDKSYANRFEIKGFMKDGDIYFVFEDNGRGLSKERLEHTITNIKSVKPEEESGYGLINIQKRIRLIYGEQYGITLESEENKLTKITMHIRAMTCEELKERLNGEYK